SFFYWVKEFLMETVFIADDEQAIREGLKCIVNWKAFDFEICGEASNGEDALARILALSPGLVIIDIRMPKMHGIDVIRELRNRGFSGKIIIISGYSDFKYAQQAIRYGVDYYLTKPVDEDELTDIISQISASLSDEKKTSQVLLHYQEKAKREILDDLVSGKADISLINADELHLDAEIYQVVIYEQYMRENETMPYQFSELLRVTNNGSYTFEHIEKDGKNVIILKGQYALDKFRRFLDHYSTPPQKGSPLDSLFLTYGSTVTSLFDIHISYEQAHILISRRFFCAPEQHTLGCDALPPREIKNDRIDHSVLGDYCTAISDYIQAFNRKKIASALAELSDYLYGVSDGIGAVKLFLTDLFLRIKEHISHTYSSAPLSFPSNSDIIAIIDKKFYLYEITEFFTAQFEAVMNAIGNSSRDSILDDIIFYIDHNYQSNIKLETIAPLFGYNSAYLGKIFSKTVGENFNNYVDSIRIKHAKRLIIENKLKVYEISEAVGYKNVDYFHKKFKKYVGQSPAEYRKLHCTEDGSDEAEKH
ncbi:MAG: response regulator, partial [Butyrivibrio sp.]|nr:response regulator [Butyrivibrio sp.]